MTQSLIGAGVYPISEVHRLTAISKSRVSRFVKKYKGAGGLWGGKAEKLDTMYYLTFKDMMELRVINAFLDKGVGWRVVCRMAEYGRERFGADYPLSHQRFPKEGERLYARALKSLGAAPAAGWSAIDKTLSNGILKSLEYEKKMPVRWYPVKNSRRIMIDGRYSFGAPVLTKSGVPTQVLYKSYLADNRNAPFVASIYRVPEDGVKSAVKYERALLRRLAA